MHFHWAAQTTLYAFLVEQELRPSLPDVWTDSGNVHSRQNEPCVRNWGPDSASF